MLLLEIKSIIKSMKVNLIKTEGLYGLAEINIGNYTLFVMDNFSKIDSQNIEIQQNTINNPYFTAIFFDLEWETMFNLNKKREKKLLKSGIWSYEAYGQIISVDPFIADFGLIKLELGNFSKDTNLLDEFLYLKIERLDLYNNSLV